MCQQQQQKNKTKQNKNKNKTKQKNKTKKKVGGEREEGERKEENRIKDDARKINNTPWVKSDLGKGRAKIQFQTSQGMNRKTGVPGEKPISRTQLMP